jgi:hypothetical protein
VLRMTVAACTLVLMLGTVLLPSSDSARAFEVVPKTACGTIYLDGVGEITPTTCNDFKAALLENAWEQVRNAPHQFQFEKKPDDTSAKLLAMAISRAVTPTVTILYDTSYPIENVRVDSYSFVASGAGSGTETFTLSFTKFTYPKSR